MISNTSKTKSASNDTAGKSRPAAGETSRDDTLHQKGPAQKGKGDDQKSKVDDH